MSALSASQQDILASGYVREYQSKNNILIPDDIASIVIDFHKETYIRSINRVNNSHNNIQLISDPNNPDKRIKSIPDQTNVSIASKLRRLCIANDTDPSLIHSISRKHGGIQLISKGISTNDSTFMYTQNGNLYRLNKKNIRKLRIDFITADNDRIIDIKNGKSHTLFLTESGKVYCFGSNESGQCGLPKHIKNTGRRLHLIQFANNDKIISISCGELHSLFINAQNALLVVGYNYSGQLGIRNENKTAEISPWTDDMDSSESSSDSDSETDDTDTDLEFFGITLRIFKPIVPDFFSENVTAIKCGLFHSIVLTNKGECFVFGNKMQCEDENIPHKVIVNNNREIIDISCTTKHDLLLLYK